MMLGQLVMMGQRAKASAERIFEILDENPEIVDRPGAYDLLDVAGAIDFNHVNFTYDNGAEILRDFDAHIAPGETVALVGRTGSGKSTVARLLTRFYDVTDGAVSIDGHDVRDVTLTSLRENVGVVLDEPFLFSISIRENIAYGRPDASLEEIEAAARAANADEFIVRLPEGYDTVDRRARLHALGRAASAHRDRAHAAAQPTDARSWTTPRARSTSTSSRASTRRCGTARRSAPPSSSRTASRRSPSRAGCCCSTRGASSPRARTRSCSRTFRCTRRSSPRRRPRGAPNGLGRLRGRWRSGDVRRQRHGRERTRGTALWRHSRGADGRGDEAARDRTRAPEVPRHTSPSCRARRSASV